MAEALLCSSSQHHRIGLLGRVGDRATTNCHNDHSIHNQFGLNDDKGDQRSSDRIPLGAVAYSIAVLCLTPYKQESCQQRSGRHAREINFLSGSVLPLKRPSFSISCHLNNLQTIIQFVIGDKGRIGL